MKCQKCNVNAATIYYTKIINGERVDICLCENCASESGIKEYPFKLNDFLTGLLELPVSYTIKETMPIKQNEHKCHKCGLTFEEFKRSGKFGCAECYSTFNEKLDPILKRLHGDTKYCGKHPGKNAIKIKTKGEIDILRNQLDQAIKEERYEKAAELRDMIKELESSSLKLEG